MAIPTNEELASVNIHLFNRLYEIKNDQGERLDFKDHAFLWDIYTDLTPTQAILKAAQVGFSTTANIKALWIAKNRGLDIIYSLPSAADIREFVSGKTNRLIANNPIFQEWTADKDSIEQKRVGSNVIYYRGTWTERAALAIPADLYISDETDRSKQEIVKQYLTRLQHSRFGWKWYFSNPSAPGVGVDKIWQESDQKHWFIKCSGCNHSDFLTMANIQGTPAIFACTKCGKELDRRLNTQWVRKWREKEVSGYWISLLMCPWITAEDVLAKKSEFTEEQFTNFVLGQPYIGRGNVLTKANLFKNLVNDINPQDATPIIGVDTGETIWYVIGNKYGIYYYGTSKDYVELELLMSRYPKAKMVIDQGGDIIGPRKLREKFPNRVFLCYFVGNRNNDELLKWDDDKGTVTADRDRMIQLTVDEFSEKRIPLWGNETDWYDYWVHWSRLYRTQVENALGVEKYHWEKSSTPCLDAETLVHTPNGERRIVDICRGDYVYTSQGVRKVRQSGKTGDKEVWEWMFSNGIKLVATSNHRISIGDGTWKELQCLTPNDSIDVLNVEKQSKPNGNIIGNSVIVNARVDGFIKGVSLVSKRRLEIRPVYDLQIEGEPEFYANGILVHNCDFPFATVYWRIGMDRFMENQAQIVMPKDSDFAPEGYTEQLDGRAFIPKHLSR